jgi:hypothetical protein
MIINRKKIVSLKSLIKTIKIKNGTNQEKEFRTKIIINRLNKQLMNKR